METQEEIIKRLENQISAEIDGTAEIIEAFNSALQNTLDSLDKFHGTVKKGDSL